MATSIASVRRKVNEDSPFVLHILKILEERAWGVVESGPYGILIPKDVLKKSEKRVGRIAGLMNEEPTPFSFVFGYVASLAAIMFVVGIGGKEYYSFLLSRQSSRFLVATGAILFLIDTFALALAIFRQHKKISWFALTAGVVVAGIISWIGYDMSQFLLHKGRYQ